MSTPYMDYWKLEPKLRPGDMVQWERSTSSSWCSWFPGAAYEHWSLYWGDGWVFDAQREPHGQVLETTLRAVSGNGQSRCRLANWLGRVGVAELGHARLWPLDRQLIVRRAKAMVGGYKFDTQYQNCEHFCTFCRYGVPISGQTLAAAKGSFAWMGGHTKENALAWPMDRFFKDYLRGEAVKRRELGWHIQRSLDKDRNNEHVDQTAFKKKVAGLRLIYP